MVVGDVAVGEDDHVHVVLAHEVRQLQLRVDRNPLRIELSGERPRAVKSRCAARTNIGGPLAYTSNALSAG